VKSEKTGAAVTRSQGFAEAPAAQVPPGTAPRLPREAREAKEFVEGLKVASPPV
jgi:hypothetical protein